MFRDILHCLRYVLAFIFNIVISFEYLFTVLKHCTRVVLTRVVRGLGHVSQIFGFSGFERSLRLQEQIPRCGFRTIPEEIFTVFPKLHRTWFEKHRSRKNKNTSSIV